MQKLNGVLRSSDKITKCFHIQHVTSRIKEARLLRTRGNLCWTNAKLPGFAHHDGRQLWALGGSWEIFCRGTNCLLLSSLPTTKWVEAILIEKYETRTVVTEEVASGQTTGSIAMWRQVWRWWPGSGDAVREEVKHMNAFIPPLVADAPVFWRAKRGPSQALG